MPVLDATFNVLVQSLTVRALLTGTQFADFAAMKKDFESRGILTVNTDFSDGTIFGGPVDNWHFRAWHDAAHLATDSDFSQAGESAAAAYQIAQVFHAYGINPTTERWAALIDCEVNAQAAHFYSTGEFVQDQYAFTVAQLRTVYGIDPDTIPSFAGTRTAAAYRAATLAAMPAAVCDPYARPLVPPAYLLDYARVYCECMATVRRNQAAAARNRNRNRRAYR
jgi:hypothetical protein